MSSSLSAAELAEMGSVYKTIAQIRDLVESYNETLLVAGKYEPWMDATKDALALAAQLAIRAHNALLQES